MRIQLKRTDSEYGSDLAPQNDSGLRVDFGDLKNTVEKLSNQFLFIKWYRKFSKFSS